MADQGSIRSRQAEDRVGAQAPSNAPFRATCRRHSDIVVLRYRPGLARSWQFTSLGGWSGDDAIASPECPDGLLGHAGGPAPRRVVSDDLDLKQPGRQTRKRSRRTEGGRPGNCIGAPRGANKPNSHPATSAEKMAVSPCKDERAPCICPAGSAPRARYHCLDGRAADRAESLQCDADVNHPANAGESEAEIGAAGQRVPDECGSPLTQTRDNLPHQQALHDCRANANGGQRQAVLPRIPTDRI
jgi:hypothetical protein